MYIPDLRPNWTSEYTNMAVLSLPPQRQIPTSSIQQHRSTSFRRKSSFTTATQIPVHHECWLKPHLLSSSPESKLPPYRSGMFGPSVLP